MDDNQDFHEKNPDLYEAILASKSLDPYEGLLNHSKMPEVLEEKDENSLLNYECDENDDSADWETYTK